jgi:DNA-directed RNA polymerase specialized sigma24 family protein
MDAKWSNNGTRASHERWRTLAFTFCDCFLGDKEKAATAAQDAFAAFLLDSRETRNDGVPLMLLRYAMGVALDRSSQDTALRASNELERTIPRLPPAERAVFILRGVLDLSPFEVALIGRTTSDEVHRLWTNSLLRLRDLWVNIEINGEQPPGVLHKF